MTLYHLYSDLVHEHTSTISCSNRIQSYLNNWKLNDDFYRNPVQSKDDVVQLLSTVDSKSVYQWAYTGGSYGEPLRVPYSQQRAFVKTATFRYFNESAGYRLGDSFALIRAKDKPGLVQFLRNETIIIPYDVSTESLNHMVNKLIKRKVKVIIGYPTVIYELALFLSKHAQLKNRLHVSSLISTSEMLDQEKRAYIKEIFCVPFVDRYSNEEVGLIAQQREFGGDYFVNLYGIYVEIVDPITSLPVREGQVGKVLVTDLCNDLLPIVRYDTGDFAVAGSYSANRLVTIRRIIGRETEEIFDVGGHPVSPLTLGPFIYKPLALQDKTIQFQFVQTDVSDYTLRLKCDSHSCSQKTLNEISLGLQRCLGHCARILIVFVNDIPPQPSGKRPVYKNEMYKNDPVFPS